MIKDIYKHKKPGDPVFYDSEDDLYEDVTDIIPQE